MLDLIPDITHAPPSDGPSWALWAGRLLLAAAIVLGGALLMPRWPRRKGV